MRVWSIYVINLFGLSCEKYDPYRYDPYCKLLSG